MVLNGPVDHVTAHEAPVLSAVITATGVTEIAGAADVPNAASSAALTVVTLEILAIIETLLDWLRFDVIVKLQPPEAIELGETSVTAGAVALPYGVTLTVAAAVP